MALKFSSVRPFDVVSANDPAIRLDGEEGQSRQLEYVWTRDLAVLLWEEGCEPGTSAGPTLFTLAPLTRGARLWVEEHDTLAARCEAAFRAMVVGVQNAVFDEGTWKPERGVAPWSRDEKALKVENVKTLEGYEGGSAVVQEVGYTGLARAYLSPGEKKVWSLPPGYKVRIANPGPAIGPIGLSTAE